jgi:hypothetical protein
MPRHREHPAVAVPPALVNGLMGVLLGYLTGTPGPSPGFSAISNARYGEQMYDDG